MLIGALGRTHGVSKRSVQSEIRTRVLDDVKSEGVTYWAMGVKDRYFTQRRVILRRIKYQERVQLSLNTFSVCLALRLLLLTLAQSPITGDHS